MRSDEQLVGLFRSGSEDAFRIIHDRYRQRLFAYSRQMLGGSGSDAEDVLQDVFLRAYRSLRVDERPVSLRAWLYRVAHNRCIDNLRRPTPPPSEIFEMSRTPIHDPTAEAERREDLRRLVADVRRLPDQQRSALLMREMDGMSYADLATALETSVPAVKSLLVRARIGLVDAIEARDTACCDIRHDLAASYDRGVRASGRARRHLRDCDGCSTYRAQLRSVRQGFASLSPSPAVTGLFAKLLGLGGASSAGAAGAAGTGSVAIGGAAAVSIGKVAAIVCCAAALTGGAVEVQKVVAPVTGTHTSPAKRINDRTLEAAVSAPAAISAAAAVAAIPHHHARHQVDVVNPLAVLHPPVAVDKPNKNGVGGALAPADTTATEPTVGTPTPTPADTLPAIDDPSIVALPGDGETSTTAATSGSSSSSSSSTSGSGSASGSSGSGSTSGSTSAGSSDATTAGTASTTSGSTGGSTSSSGGASPSGPPATTQTHP